MKRIITINSNQVDKSVETKKILTDKLINAGFEVTYDFCKNAELIISIGGDGSFLKTVHDYNFIQTPIVGINTGHLGFFPEIPPNNIDSFIKSYKNNDFLIQDIALIKANISPPITVCCCILSNSSGSSEHDLRNTASSMAIFPTS